MDFFNRLGDFAKNMSDRTNDLLEIGKLNSKIRVEEDEIEQHKLDLGQYTWEKFNNGVAMDEQATVYCLAIRERLGTIESLKSQIREIKETQEFEKVQQRQKDEARTQMRTQRRELVDELSTAAQSAAAPVSACPACGASVPKGASFCGSCGTRLN